MESLTDDEIIDQVKLKPLVNAKTLATLTSLSYGRIRQLNQLPNCPVIKIGRSCRYDAAEFIQWLKDGGVAAGKQLQRQNMRAQHG